MFGARRPPPPGALLFASAICGANLCGYSVKSNERILINMKPDGSKWSGRIHDPDSGRNYDSTIAMKRPECDARAGLCLRHVLRRPDLEAGQLGLTFPDCSEVRRPRQRQADIRFLPTGGRFMWIAGRAIRAVSRWN
ncbi:hypothetical protein AB7M47_004030 [Bradyrhizobium elkanii]